MYASILNVFNCIALMLSSIAPMKSPNSYLALPLTLYAECDSVINVVGIRSLFSGNPSLVLENHSLISGNHLLNKYLEFADKSVDIPDSSSILMVQEQSSMAPE